VLIHSASLPRRLHPRSWRAASRIRESDRAKRPQLKAASVALGQVELAGTDPTPPPPMRWRNSKWLNLGDGKGRSQPFDLTAIIDCSDLSDLSGALTGTVSGAYDSQKFRFLMKRYAAGQYATASSKGERGLLHCH